MMEDKTILLVDDEEGIRKVLSISLSDMGYKVRTAAGGDEAISILKESPHSIVLTDIKMPGMDGIELLRKVKREHPETEVIMVTGHGDLELAIKSLQFEAADFVTKPVNDDALEIALKRVHERIWMRRKLREYTENLERMVQEKTEELVKAERLAAVGQTVATIAHSIKNIISGLAGGVFIMEKGMELQRQQYLDQGWTMIKGNVDKVKGLALDLLNYAKERVPSLAACDPNEPLREVYQLMQQKAGQCGILLRCDACEKLPKVMMDSEAIHCCLLNLASNALDACTEADETGRRLEVVLRSSKADGWSVAYEVADSGCGMDPEMLDKVFKGFFSTKGSKGTGLGLMITQKIIHEHRGSIGVESEKGKGTKFTIRLP